MVGDLHVARTRRCRREDLKKIAGEWGRLYLKAAPWPPVRNVRRCRRGDRYPMLKRR